MFIIAPSRRRSESVVSCSRRWLGIRRGKLKNSLYVWAGPNTEWLKECDIKLELAREFFRDFLDIHAMTQEQVELYEMHKPNLSSSVNLIEESPRKKLKGIGNTSRKPQKCCVITDVAECPADLRAMHQKLQQMLAEAPPPSATQFDKDKFKPYELKLTVSADELVLQAKKAEPRFDIKFELQGSNVWSSGSTP